MKAQINICYKKNTHRLCFIFSCSKNSNCLMKGKYYFS